MFDFLLEVSMKQIVKETLDLFVPNHMKYLDKLCCCNTYTTDTYLEVFDAVNSRKM